jgi:phospholipid/cholesterol/gamma-HCH transport system substrate-binding protein
MKRLLGIACALVAASALAVFATGSGDGGTYRVRAIFMNAFSVIPGEDVKVAGVKVGKVESLDVTPDHKAAVVLRIDRPGFDDFRTDAQCTIRPQSLIGEKFVECTPTQPRPENAQAAPRLRKITRGPGKGQYLLPVDRTSKPVDLDLINNTLRLPFRERLAIIVNELGTGLAGRGGDLRQAIENADPALKETDQVLAILASQNKALSSLATDSDAILAPLARDRANVADFVDKANTTAVATAERSPDLERNIQKLPTFLRELQPTMARLGSLSDQMTPVLSDLGRSAPDVNRFIKQLGPFSQAGIPALQSLGDAADVGRPALVKSKPIITQVGQLASSAKPLTQNLASLTTSLRDTGGIERLMDYLFYQVTAINGYDAVGHYLRAGLLLNTCSQYAITFSPDCSAKFSSATGSAASAAAARAASASSVPGYADDRRSPALRRLDALLHGKSLTLGHRKAKHHRKARHHARKHTSADKSGSQDAPLSLPPAVLPGGGGSQPADTQPAPEAAAQPAPAATQPAPTTTSSQGAGAQQPSGPVQSLLDYLLGGGG